jgi:hypothetical protein
MSTRIPVTAVSHAENNGLRTAADDVTLTDVGDLLLSFQTKRVSYVKAVSTVLNGTGYLRKTPPVT